MPQIGVKSSNRNRFITAESITPDGGDLRFTQTDDAFYISSLSVPLETVIIDVPIPVLPGDSITMIGAGNDTVLNWSIASDGSVSIDVPPALIADGKYCWVLKVTYLA